LRTRQREMRGYGGNHDENLGHTINLGESQFTIPDTAGMSCDLACNHNDTWFSQSNPASRTPDYAYLLVSSTSFSSSSPICLFLFHNSTIIAAQKVKSSLSILPCHDHEFAPSIAYNEYSIHRVGHTPSTASIQDYLSFFHAQDYEFTPECSFSFRRASAGELNGQVTLSQSHGSGN
jgi:hypothetical protein